MNRDVTYIRRHEWEDLLPTRRHREPLRTGLPPKAVEHPTKLRLLNAALDLWLLRRGIRWSHRWWDGAL